MALDKGPSHHASMRIPHGEISAINNSTEHAIASQGVAVQVTIFDTNGESYGSTPDHTEDHILIGTAGTYMVNVSATINSVAGSNSVFEISVAKNNNASQIVPHMDRNLTAGGGEAGVISMSGLAALDVGDTVEVWLENETNTTNYVVEDICLSIFQVA